MPTSIDITFVVVERFLPACLATKETILLVMMISGKSDGSALSCGVVERIEFVPHSWSIAASAFAYRTASDD